MSFPVHVYIYEVTKGMARSMSRFLLGRQIDGVWHTGIVAYGNEYFFGSGGITYCIPGELFIGQPDEIVELGSTEIPREIFEEYLIALSQTTFRGECYHLLDHNCNTFSNEVSQFLTGNTIPERITSLPKEVLNTPFGQMVRPLIDNMMGTVNQGLNIGTRHQLSVTAIDQTTRASNSSSQFQNSAAESLSSYLVANSVVTRPDTRHDSYPQQNHTNVADAGKSSPMESSGNVLVPDKTSTERKHCQKEMDLD